MDGLVVAFWGVLGTAVGSFLNVVADRLPEGRSVFRPPSSCPACGARLGPAELVPVISYLALRGRCRRCGTPIGWRTLWVEIGTGILFALAAWRSPPVDLQSWLGLALLSAYLSVLVAVTVTDIERGLILNRVMVPALVLAGLASLLDGWPGALMRLAAGLIGAGLIAGIILLVPGGMGWGDVRLAGFVGLVIGLPGTFFALFIAFVIGGLVAGVLLATGRRRRGDTLPLGPFLALGCGVVLLSGDALMQAFIALAALI